MQSDITHKRKQFEQALHKNEEFFRHLVESTNAVPWKVDLSTWRFIYVGPQSIALLGYPVETWYEENFWFEHLHPEDRDAAISFCQTQTSRGEDHEFEYRMIAADGKVVWIYDSVNVVKDGTDPISLQGYMFDITAHKQTTDALARSKAEFETMFNAIPDAVMFADTERRIVMNNPAVHDMFGYSDEELIGQTTEMLYADKQDFEDQGRRRYRTGPDAETTPYEVRYKRKNGTVFWTETLGTQVKNANGAVIGFIAIFRDITERKRSEAALQKSEKRFKTQYKSFPIPTYTWQRQGKDFVLIDVNDAATTFTHGKISSLVGVKAHELYADTPQVLEDLSRCFSDKHPVKWEGPFSLKSTGEEKYFNITYAFVPPDLVMVHTEDISERKQSEEALRKSEYAYRTLAENLPGIVYRLYREGNHNRLQFFNKMGEKVTGYTDQELTLGEVCSFEQLIVDEDQPRVVAKLKEAIAKNTPFTLRYQIRHKDGSHRYILDQGTPIIGTDGKLLYIDGVMFDVTEHKRADEAIRDSEKELSAILDSLQDAYYRADSKGRLTRISPSVQKLLGYTPQQLLGKIPTDLYVDPQGRKKFLRQLEKQGGVIENYEVQLRHKDGSTVWVSTNAHTIRDERGTPIGLEGTTRDIGQIKSAEDLLNRFGRILDNSSNEIYIFDAESMRFSLVNRGARHNLGYSMQELEQLTALDLKPDFTLESFTELIQPLYLGEQEQVVFQTRHRRKDGTMYPVEVSLQLSHEESPPVFVAIIQDISERIQNEEQLQYLAHHDALTTLPNRVLFTDRLDQSLARTHWHGRAVAVLFLDLDRFKLINDTLGHDVGDRALQALSERLQNCVREGDTVARLGGDEFAIVLEDVATADDVAPTARKILDVLSQPFHLDKHEFILTTSIGISLFPIDGQNTQTLLKHADIAMYRAKEQGRNTYQFYSADMSAKAFERLSMETNLRHALEREEFVLYYQPQQNLADGRIFGVEALIRWQHPDLGLISPADFVPLLEETGLIIPVGEWVLHTACLQARTWNDSGLKPLRMSVNLSGRQTNNSNFIATVEQVLKDSKLDPTLLELEMTESILMHNVQATIKTLKAISEMGIRLAIDDFGTGYSSLSYLKRFPIDTLKIDRSFIHDITKDPDDATLVEAIIAMGRALNLNVIAEGVETEQQVKFLRSHNCDSIQGFLFSQPLPAEEVMSLLHEKLSSAGKEKGSSDI